MIARQLISDLIPPLNFSDSCDKALVWMTEFQVRHLPIVEQGKFVGLVSEDEIYDLNNAEQIFADINIKFQTTAVTEFEHLYEVMKIMLERKLTLVPIVDAENHYLGIVTRDSLLLHFGRSLAVAEPGAILVLEMNESDYSMSEISRIIEAENVKILSSYMAKQIEASRLELTLKLNKSDLQNVISTLEKFNYEIKGYFQETGNSEDLQERYDALMRYLNF